MAIFIHIDDYFFSLKHYYKNDYSDLVLVNLVFRVPTFLWNLELYQVKAIYH